MGTGMVAVEKAFRDEPQAGMNKITRAMNNLFIILSSLLAMTFKIIP
jgi:hypothetical protein